MAKRSTSRRQVSSQACAIARQYAALPFSRSGDLSILLVTSRETGRWVLPKGWPMKGKKPQAAAAREALEEAGVTGQIAKRSVGAYPYRKRLPEGDYIECTVEVFPLEVARQRKRWPEQSQRRSQWFSPRDAADAVQEAELAALITSFAESLLASETV